jgi:hypothetical protein
MRLRGELKREPMPVTALGRQAARGARIDLDELQAFRLRGHLRRAGALRRARKEGMSNVPHAT